MNLLKELKQRGLIHQVTHEEDLENHLSNNSITLYCGFDPTADSLHVGSLLPLVTLMRFKNAGHNPLALIGGSTGMIGDPSFKAAERKLNDVDTVKNFCLDINGQISKITGVECINNNDWTKMISIIDFLRDVGKHFSVNSMINKESVKQRIDRDEQGISFTEFSYSLLQSMDFNFLNENKNCTLQIGGSDQWGNITSGIDLIRKTRGKEAKAFALTIPLITKSDGTKFGKSEGGNVWLSAEKTSPFKFFQFWLNTADSDIEKFLKFFTFFSIEEIEKIMKEDEGRKKPLAQEILAKEITLLVHGEESLSAAERITNAVFNNDFSLLTEDDFKQLSLDGLDVFPIGDSNNIVDVLIDCKLATSKRQAREFIQNNAISVNGAKDLRLDTVLNPETAFFGKWFIVKRGKRNVSMVKL